MDVTTAAIRELLKLDVDAPVTSVYLNTDGARYPAPRDYEARLDGLLRDVRKAAEGMPQAERDAVGADADAIRRFVRDRFERSDVRGLGVFASGGRILDTVLVAQGVRNQARVNRTPYVVPLQVLLGRHHHIALAIIERDKARILRYRLGRIEESRGLTSDVHGQHQQGGFSQARFERSIDREVLYHMRDAADALRAAHEDDPFDAVIIAGPRPEAKEFVEQLHPYLRDLVHGDPIAMDVNPETPTLLEKFGELEQTLVSERRAHLLRRLAAGQGSAERAAYGLRAVVEAVNRQNVEVLFVVEGAGQPGFRTSAGALALRRDEAEAFGGDVEPVDDLIDEIIEAAVMAGAHTELFRDAVRLDGHPVAALLRY